MSFGSLKTRLRALINRKDFTDELAGSFVTEAIADLERTLRIAPMELLVTKTDWDGIRNALLVPTGFIEAISIFTDEVSLTQVDLATFLSNAGANTFVKVADRWLLKTTPAAGSRVYLHYYTQSKPLRVDEDTNVWTTAAFNAVVYQAATLAADFYQMEDEYAQRFQNKADTHIEALREQDLDEKWSGRLAIPLPSDLGNF